MNLVEAARLAKETGRKFTSTREKEKYYYRWEGDCLSTHRMDTCAYVVGHWSDYVSSVDLLRNDFYLLPEGEEG